MPQIAICLFISGALFFAVLRLLQVPLTHPINLTIFPQWFLLAYTCLDLRHHLTAFSHLTWIVLLGSMAAFLFGCLTSSIATTAWYKFPKTKAFSYDPWKSLLITFTGFAIAYVWGLIRVGNIPLFSRHPETERGIFVSGNLQSILFACIMPTISFCLVGLNANTSGAYKRTAFLISLVVIPFYFTTGGRGLVLFFLIISLIFIDVCVKPIQVRTLVVAIFALAAVFVGVGYLRYGRFAQSSAKIGWEVVAKFGTEGIYDYSGNGFWNLDYALGKWQNGTLNIPTYGASSGEGLLSLFGLSGQIQTAYHWDGAMNTSVTKIGGLNSTTFHWALIKDFGIAAPWVWSFLMGVILTALDRYSRAKKSIRASLLLGHLQYYSFIGFNIFPFVLALPIAGTGILCIGLLSMQGTKKRSSL